MNLKRVFVSLAVTLGTASVAFDAPAQSFSLSSPVFEENETIPTLYTCDGSNVSPPLMWGDSPRPAASYAVVMLDRDAHGKGGAPFVHWVIFNLAPDVKTLAENMRRNRLPGAAAEGTNDFKREGYDGPCPPSGKHSYAFTVYALDTMLDRARYQKATFAEIEQAMQGHIVAEATTVGIYSRGK